MFLIFQGLTEKKDLIRLKTVENLSSLGRVEEIAAKLKGEEVFQEWYNVGSNLFRPFPNCSGNVGFRLGRKKSFVLLRPTAEL